MEVFGTLILVAGVAVILWILNTVVPCLKEAMMCRKGVAGLPNRPYTWPLGSLPFVTEVGRVNFFLEIIRIAKEKKAKVLVFWRTFLDPSIFVTHSDTARDILRTSEPKNRKFKLGYGCFLPWIGDGLLLSSDRKWERSRKLLTPAFHFSILKPYVQVYNDTVDILLSKIEKETGGGKSYEIFHPVSLCTLDVMLRCAFSFNDGIQQVGSAHPYVKAISRVSTLVVERDLKPWFFSDVIYKLTSDGREFFKLCKYIHEFSDNIIQKRRKSLEDDKDVLLKRHLDFLDILLTARDEDNVGLSTEDIRAEADTFLFEGHDTTASAISWSLYALAKYPEMQERVYQEVNSVIGHGVLSWQGLSELHYTSLFLKEVLRMYSPVPFIGRTLSKSMMIDGAEISAGTIVCIPIIVVHHNPDVWENPEEFRPERFSEEAFRSHDPYSFIPFSAGPRNCIGQNFAMNEEKVIVSRIVNRFKIEIDPDQAVVQLPEVVMRAKYGLKLKFTLRE